MEEKIEDLVIPDETPIGTGGITSLVEGTTSTSRTSKIGFEEYIGPDSRGYETEDYGVDITSYDEGLI
tara:strand:+ start:557 stop:760 length:204 start_codon:yes stop_codon:yes gene_type:complete